jgi:hypothetical protein
VSTAARAERLRGLVGAVARQALTDRGLERLALIDDGSPEAVLAGQWLDTELDASRVHRVVHAPGVEPLLQQLLTLEGELEIEGGRVAYELRRMRARLVPGALVTNPANKTSLLLEGALPPDPFFPLGDLYASDVEQLTGGYTLGDRARELADRCGGIAALDDALRARFDRREPNGLARLEPRAAARIVAALAVGRASRTIAVLVPKLGPRTIGVDLFE